MTDRVETLGRSLVQHGPLNDRIYLMRLHRPDLPDLLPALERLARDRGYGKILARIPAEASAAFEADGYAPEVVVPGMMAAEQDGLFVTRYLSSERSREREPERLAAVRRALQQIAAACELPDEDVQPCDPADAPAMSDVYRSVFASYPFPIHDAGYLAAVMAKNSRYFCVRRAHRIVALGAAEIDPEGRNAEMTDLAVLPEFRGRGLALCLLARMEAAAADAGVRTLFTIARALSTSANAVFKRMGYRFAGTLTNSTHIAGRIQSMSVWYKDAPPPESST